MGCVTEDMWDEWDECTQDQLSRDQLPHDQLLQYQLFMK